ncbi:hypothetical protein BAE44_0019574, partial [Dichanthelium oligosanthes]
LVFFPISMHFTAPPEIPSRGMSSPGKVLRFASN